jgi:hypothetical protein
MGACGRLMAIASLVRFAEPAIVTLPTSRKASDVVMRSRSVRLDD